MCPEGESDHHIITSYIGKKWKRPKKAPNDLRKEKEIHETFFQSKTKNAGPREWDGGGRLHTTGKTKKK